MTNFKWVVLLLCGVLGCASVPRQIMVNGIGVSLEEAKKDAIRRALQAEVGSFVLSELEVSQEQIVTDNLSEYSGAMVDRLEILRTEQRADGWWMITAKMAVRDDAKRQKVRMPEPTPGFIDGQSLNAIALSIKQRRFAAVATWQKVLNRMAFRAFRMEAMSLGISNPDSNDQVTLAVAAVPHWRMDYVEELRQALKYAATPVSQNGNMWYHGYPEPNQTGICLTEGFRVGRTECYIIDVESKTVQDWLCYFNGLQLQIANPGPYHPQWAQSSNRVVSLPFVDIDRNNGGSLNFFVNVVDDEDLMRDSNYPDFVWTTVWKAKVPVTQLSQLKAVSAYLQCKY